jgi:3,4-dihydroxy 2-butanone 4-phosphate synthase / GTP cyclohydrolase II
MAAIWQMHVYANKVAYAEHIALVKGDLSTKEPVLVRMHALERARRRAGQRQERPRRAVAPPWT